MRLKLTSLLGTVSYAVSFSAEETWEPCGQLFVQPSSIVRFKNDVNNAGVAYIFAGKIQFIWLNILGVSYSS